MVLNQCTQGLGADFPISKRFPECPGRFFCIFPGNSWSSAWLKDLPIPPAARSVSASFIPGCFPFVKPIKSLEAPLFGHSFRVAVSPEVAQPQFSPSDSFRSPRISPACSWKLVVNVSAPPSPIPSWDFWGWGVEMRGGGLLGTPVRLLGLGGELFWWQKSGFGSRAWLLVCPSTLGAWRRRR